MNLAVGSWEARCVVLASVIWTTACVNGIASDVRESGEERIRMLIDNVAASELIYADLEVVGVADYTLVKDVDPAEAAEVGFIKESRERERSIVQDGRVWFERSRDYQGFVGDVRGEYGTSRYDGEYTRSLWGGLANIEEGKNDSIGWFRPHLFILANDGAWRTTLSRVLSGEAYGIWERVVPVFVGDEEVDGLRCVKVDIELFVDGGSDSDFDIRTFWICPERNYLPVKMVGRTHGSEIPLEEARVDDLREIEPGVWFPFRMVFEVNDEIAASEGENVLSNRRVWTISKADIDPDYPVTFFSNLEIPDGTRVTLIRRGEPYRSYTQGASQKEQASWMWLLLANIVVVSLLLAILLVRRRKQVRPVNSTV